VSAGPASPGSPRIRPAGVDDLAVLVRFNAALALETEGKTLDLEVCSRGVLKAFADPDRLRYWVAESDGSTEVVGQAAVTREWSDWRAGWVWWFQSVYVVPRSRQRGVFRALHGAIRRVARASDDVVGLRLYVEEQNHRAQQTYRGLGMRPGGYVVYEEIWPERFGGQGDGSSPE